MMGRVAALLGMARPRGQSLPSPACGRKTRSSLFLWTFLVLLNSASAWAVQPDEILPDAALESRARDISAGLRCLVCQNQSIDDSAAPLARDLRLIVRERLKAGDNDDAVRAYLVARYGDFVLLKPPVNRETLLLWGAPFLVLILGAAGLVLRRRPNLSASPPLSLEEQARLDALTRDAPAG